ncbi:hypothetical protein PoB_003854300 [Plakobranchus ocellatus]|uniref:Uncharacterized protein n=1 Tax=Plakobranchus ocellatus TaxID=259542 RepID=A0AAV4AXI1_9GAST|nr:hypothetical protein PoB_003854300 [Plakobranchus ocellatus]
MGTRDARHPPNFLPASAATPVRFGRWCSCCACYYVGGIDSSSFRTLSCPALSAPRRSSLPHSLPPGLPPLDSPLSKNRNTIDRTFERVDGDWVES